MMSFALKNKIIIFSLIFSLFLIPYSFSEDCCDIIDKFLPSQMTSTFNPDNKMAVITLFAKNDSDSDNPIKPLENAPILIYITEPNSPDYIVSGPYYTDSKGKLNVNIAQIYQDTTGKEINENAYIKTFKFIYCPLQCSCMDCWNTFGVNITKYGYTSETDLFPEPHPIQSPEYALPTYRTIVYTPPPKVGYPAFCLPLVLIFTFLGGSLYLTGRNPFSVFDMSAPQMKKHFRYSARGRGWIFDTTSVAGAIAKAVSYGKDTAKGKGEIKKDAKGKFSMKETLKQEKATWVSFGKLLSDDASRTKAVNTASLPAAGGAGSTAIREAAGTTGATRSFSSLPVIGVFFSALDIASGIKNIDQHKAKAMQTSTSNFLINQVLGRIGILREIFMVYNACASEGYTTYDIKWGLASEASSRLQSYSSVAQRTDLSDVHPPSGGPSERDIAEREQQSRGVRIHKGDVEIYHQSKGWTSIGSLKGADLELLSGSKVRTAIFEISVDLGTLSSMRLSDAVDAQRTLNNLTREFIRQDLGVHKGGLGERITGMLEDKPVSVEVDGEKYEVSLVAQPKAGGGVELVTVVKNKDGDAIRPDVDSALLQRVYAETTQSLTTATLPEHLRGQAIPGLAGPLLNMHRTDDPATGETFDVRTFLTITSDGRIGTDVHLTPFSETPTFGLPQSVPSSSTPSEDMLRSIAIGGESSFVGGLTTTFARNSGETIEYLNRMRQAADSYQYASQELMGVYKTLEREGVTANAEVIQRGILLIPSYFTLEAAGLHSNGIVTDSSLRTERTDPEKSQIKLMELATMEAGLRAMQFAAEASRYNASTSTFSDSHVHTLIATEAIQELLKKQEQLREDLVRLNKDYEALPKGSSREEIQKREAYYAEVAKTIDIYMPKPQEPPSLAPGEVALPPQPTRTIREDYQDYFGVFKGLHEVYSSPDTRSADVDIKSIDAQVGLILDSTYSRPAQVEGLRVLNAAVRQDPTITLF
ncbi:MAG: hypothetical protein PHU63_03855, partial [Candidatus ainarchaeum sp.]|nr:hypothetical protein [Candidatus ainarchaeum sp.]